MRYRISILIFTTVGLLSVWSCENRDLNEGESFQPREIHENIPFHFQKIDVDGIEYLILEKDNNNPHEGFGFMAFRANKLMEKQDTVLAYLRTIQTRQDLIIAKLTNQPIDKVREDARELFQKYISEETDELILLEENKFSSEEE